MPHPTPLTGRSRAPTSGSSRCGWANRRPRRQWTCPTAPCWAYHASREEVMANLPTDGTGIVAYCEYPRAAAESVVRKLREGGLTHTAVLWEGIQGWVRLGYPVVGGNPARTSERGE